MYDGELHETFMDYSVMANKTNAVPCQRKLNDFQYTNFEEAIRDGYRFKLYVDGLPSAVVVRDPVTGEVYNEYDDGIPVGKYIYDKTTDSSRYILYNHWILNIKESPIDETKKVRIVGFEVEPRSYWPGEEISLEYNKHKPLYLDELKQLEEDKQIFNFSYTVLSQMDSTTIWSNRMDHYMKFGNENVHFSAIFVSLGIIIALAILLNFALDKRVKRDFMNIYKNQMAQNQRRQERARLPRQEEEESKRLSAKNKKGSGSFEDENAVGWKKIHGDVMRKPQMLNVLACFLGAGN